MAKKEIYSVGWNFPGNFGKNIDFYSKHSLADADIIIFNLGGLALWGSDSYQGKPCLDDVGSFKAKEAAAHWQQELTKAYKEGKSVFIFLSQKQEAYVETGEKRTSGTGRNQKVTRIVTRLNNYNSLPESGLNFEDGAGSGTFSSKETRLILPLWEGFLKKAEYFTEIIPDKGSSYKSLISSKNGKRSLGGIIQGLGNFIFIPPIPEHEKHYLYNEKKDETYWSKEGEKFGARLFDAIIRTETLIKAEVGVTPPPDWVADKAYIFPTENKIIVNIEKLNKEKLKIEKKIEQERLGLNKYFLLKRLLYEKGKPLEEAILKSLRLLGFEAENFDDGEMEFDAVFISLEGRFIGEAEGRDSKPIAITKISQLIRNLHDDLARDEVEDLAQGVLFGNPQRLLPINDRKDKFTNKALKSSAHSDIALIFTPDLYPISAFLSDHKNDEFSLACRQAIFNTKGGIVKFPPIPKTK